MATLTVTEPTPTVDQPTTIEDTPKKIREEVGVESRTEAQERIENWKQQLADIEAGALEVQAGIQKLAEEEKKGEKPSGIGEPPGGDYVNYILVGGEWVKRTDLGDDEDGDVDPNAQTIIDLQTELAQNKKDYDEAVSQLSTSSSAFDDITKDLVASITRTYASRIAIMEDINMRAVEGMRSFGIRMGTQRYAGLIAGGLLTAEERAGQLKVSQLEGQRDQAIAEAKWALQNKKYSMVQDKIDLVETRREEIKNTLENLSKITQEENERVEEKKRKAELTNTILQLEEEGLDITDRGEVYKALDKIGITPSIEELDELLDMITIKEENITPPNSYKEWSFAGGLEGTGKTYNEWLQEKKAPSYTEQQNALKTSALAKVKGYFEQWKQTKMGGYGVWTDKQGNQYSGFKPPDPTWDGYIDPQDYMSLRQDFAAIIGDASLFDEVFAPLLNPTERARLLKTYKPGGLEEGTQFLNKDYFRGLYTEDILKQEAQKAGFKKDIEAYLDYLMRQVETHRGTGLYSDKDILKMMQ